MPKNISLLAVLLCLSLPVLAQDASAPAETAAAPAKETAAAAAPASAAPAEKAAPAAEKPAPAAEKAKPEAVPAEKTEKAEKPAPAEEKQAEEPKPAAKVAKKAEKPAAPSDRVEAEWTFLQAAAADQKAGDAEAESLTSFILQHPDAPVAQDARALLAKLFEKRGDRKFAMMTLLHLLYEAPGSKDALRAKSDFLELAAKELSRKLRPAAGELVKIPEEEKREDRLSIMHERVIEALGDALYEPSTREIQGFRIRFPSYERGDREQWSLAQLYESHENYEAASLGYRQLIAVYPDSDYHPKALFALGGIYAEHLKDYKKAIDSYQDLVQKYPDNSMVLPALQATAKLFSERLKQYELAVQVDESIVKQFPKTDGALQAYKDEAKLLRDKLEKPADAVSALKRLAADFPAPAGVEALQNAADIARRDLKDYKQEISLREAIAADFASEAETAAEELYNAGGVYEDDLKDVDGAIKTYKEASSKFSKTKYGRKSGERAMKLQNKKG